MIFQLIGLLVICAIGLYALFGAMFALYATLCLGSFKKSDLVVLGIFMTIGGALLYYAYTHSPIHITITP